MLTVFIRSVLLVCLAVCALRLMGKRQVGQLQPFELVIAIMIADLAATPMESLDTPLWRGIVPMAALVMLHQIFSLLSLKSQKMRRFFSGSPTVIIRTRLSSLQPTWPARRSARANVASDTSSGTQPLPE